MGGSLYTWNRYRGTCPNGHPIVTRVYENGSRDGKDVRCSDCGEIGYATDVEGLGDSEHAGEVNS